MQSLATFHVSLTMRFPRALAIRDDLDISDCLTLSGTSANPFNGSFLTETSGPQRRTFGPKA